MSVTVSSAPRPSRLTSLALVLALVAAVLAVTSAPSGGATDDVRRLAGANRFATAIEISRDTHADDSVTTAVLVNGTAFADALAAAPLAVAVGGPVLLNGKDGLEPVVIAELDRLGVSEVILMGGTAVLSAQVEQDLVDFLDVTVVRVAGAGRFETAADAAIESVFRLDGDTQSAGAILALGNAPNPNRAWPDALAAGPLAGHRGVPILLTRPDTVPAATKQALRDLGTTDLTIVGGTGAITQAVEDFLAETYTITRIFGPDRFATATAVADAAIAAGGSADTVFYASGFGFADALAAGPAAVAKGGVLVLTNPNDLDASPATRRWIEANTPTDNVVVGGNAAVTAPIDAQIQHAQNGPVDSLAAPAVSLDPVVQLSSTPLTATAPSGSDKLYVGERAGRIRIVDLADDRLLTTVFLDIRDRVGTTGERGLLGLAFHPDFANNRRFFVHYSRESDGATIVDEYEARVDVASGLLLGDETTRRELLVAAQPFSNHNGGSLAFGPDGMLYLFLGDGGSSGDPEGNGQDPTTLLGSALRLDVSTPGVAVGAEGNGFVDDGGDARVWSIGLRNPYRATFDLVTGTAYISDVGESSVEEINAVDAPGEGYNFGWNEVEGDQCFPATASCDLGGFTAPIHRYGRDQGSSVIGGEVYRGSNGALRGHYFFGDLTGGWIRSFRVVDGVRREFSDWTSVLGWTGSVFSFGSDGQGRVYIMDSRTLYRIDVAD